jgi:hypothetical protein
MALYIPRSDAVFLLAFLLGLCTSGASLVMVATFEDCYIYEVCCFDGFIKYMYIWSPVMNSSVSYCGSVIVLFEFCNAECGSYL